MPHDTFDPRLPRLAAHLLGAMPEGFWFPDPTVSVWLSEEVDPEDRSGNYSLIARMPPGVAVPAMDLQLDRITHKLDERFDYPEQWDPTKDPELTPVRRHLLGRVEPALLGLLGATVLILLIASVNVSALMLGQVESRGTELALRRALGAGRKRLLRQIVVESLVIGVLAGLTGAALGAAGFPFLVGVLPLGALAEAARLDWSLLWTALVVAVLAATAVALAPAASLGRGDLQGTLRRSRTAGVGGRGGRLEHGLVVGQVALVLLATGIAVGLAAFFALARLLASFLYGVGTADPLALAGAASVLLAAGLLATSVPACRASRIPLTKVLREQ